jgi:TusA-related sulfurtransferase
MKSVGDYILDLRGLVCPVPEIEVKKKLMELRIGESLEVLVDNLAPVEITFPEVAKLFRCRYEVFNMGDYVSFVFYKLSATPTRTEYVKELRTKT